MKGTIPKSEEQNTSNYIRKEPCSLCSLSLSSLPKEQSSHRQQAVATTRWHHLPASLAQKGYCSFSLRFLPTLFRNISLVTYCRIDPRKYKDLPSALVGTRNFIPILLMDRFLSPPSLQPIYIF